MHYYKYKWNETRGDQFDNWGYSWWYFEIGEDDYISRQVEIYDNGKILKYSEQHQEDEFGGLGYEKFNPNQFDNNQITKEDFEKVWKKKEEMKTPH